MDCRDDGPPPSVHSRRSSCQLDLLEFLGFPAVLEVLVLPGDPEEHKQDDDDDVRPAEKTWCPGCCTYQIPLGTVGSIVSSNTLRKEKLKSIKVSMTTG